MSGGGAAVATELHAMAGKLEAMANCGEIKDQARCSGIDIAVDELRIRADELGGASGDEGPGGYVVVSFGGEADGWCTLNKCPMGSAPWFPTQELARAHADALPDWCQPHIIMVRDR